MKRVGTRGAAHECQTPNLAISTPRAARDTIARQMDECQSAVERSAIPENIPMSAQNKNDKAIALER